MRRRDAVKLAEKLWGKDFFIKSFRCKKGCDHSECPGNRYHYEGGENVQASGLLPKQPIIKAHGFSWEELFKKAV